MLFKQNLFANIFLLSEKENIGSKYRVLPNNVKFVYQRIKSVSVQKQKQVVASDIGGSKKKKQKFRQLYFLLYSHDFKVLFQNIKLCCPILL